MGQLGVQLGPQEVTEFGGKRLLGLQFFRLRDFVVSWGLFGPSWGCLGTNLGSFWDGFGTMLGPFWDHFVPYLDQCLLQLLCLVCLHFFDFFNCFYPRPGRLRAAL